MIKNGRKNYLIVSIKVQMLILVSDYEREEDTLHHPEREGPMIVKWYVACNRISGDFNEKGSEF